MKYKAEIFDIWQYLCGKCQNYVPLIRCRIDFAGRVDLEILKQAVEQSFKTIPLARYCFDVCSNKPRWVDRGFTGEDIVCIVEAEEDEEKQVLQYFSTEIDSTAQPQLKIIVIRGTAGDILCIIISHIICDGTGFKQYIYLLSELYTALRNGKELPVQAFYPRGLKPLKASVSFREKVQILRSNFTLERSSVIHPGFDFNTGESGTYMEKRTLSKECFAAFKAFAKSNGATVNDGLMALFTRALCKNTDAESLHLPSTIDLRKFISKGRKYGITNFACFCMCNIPVYPEDSLADTIKRVSGQMVRHKSGKDILKPILIWDLVAHYVSYRKIRDLFEKTLDMPVISFTNIGIIDAELLNFDNIPIKDAYLTSPLKPRPHLQLGVSTYEGRCTLSANIYGSQDDSQFVNRLLDDMSDEVNAISCLPKNTGIYK